MERDERLKQLGRLFLLYHILESGGIVRGQDLVAACHVTPRTVGRDLNVLRAAGASIIYDRRRSSYVLEHPLPCHAVELPTSDLLALAMAQATLPPGAPYEAFARRAFERLTARLPHRLREELSHSRALAEAGTPLRRDYSGDFWQTLFGAAARHETVELDYESLSQNRRTLRQVDPYHLVLPHGYLQLVAWCHTRREMRLFALDGVHGVRPTGQQFEPMAGFSLARWMEGSLGTLRGEPVEIVVRFEATLARWAQRRRWNFRHTLTPDPAHPGALLLRGTTSGLQEIKRELLSWGSGVTVLSPPELRDIMRREAEAMLQNYATSNS